MADAPAGVPSWRITGQQTGLDRGPGGDFVKGVNIHFTTASGASGSVFVPDTEYTAANAEDIIRQRVADRAGQMDRIASMTG